MARVITEETKELTTLEQLKAECDTALEALNKVIRSDDPKERTAEKRDAAAAALKEACQKWSQENEAETVQICAESESPIEMALEIMQVETLGFKYITDKDVNGIPVTLSAAYTMRKKQLSLDKICRKAELPLDWLYLLEGLNKLFCLDVAIGVGMTKKEQAKIARDFRMPKQAKALEEGGTPTSTTQFVKKMQEIVDKLTASFAQPGTFKVRTMDYKFLRETYCKLSSKELYTLATSNTTQLVKVFAQLMHQIIHGKHYDVEYRSTEKKGEAKASAPKAPSKKEEVTPKDIVNPVVQQTEAKATASA